VTKPSFAVVGAGIGGLAAAAFLDRQGINVTVYEQAEEFLRIGAGIQMSPNAMRVLRELELEPRLRKIGIRFGKRLVGIDRRGAADDEPSGARRSRLDDSRLEARIVPFRCQPKGSLRSADI
jgi:2-polyprenyl-6-methoxyphenol hydroxylase-like FAD-dependent oxidoreductase